MGEPWVPPCSSASTTSTLVLERGPEQSGPFLFLLRRVPLDLEVRQPFEPFRQVPVPVAEEPHQAREEDGADDRRVEEQRDRDAEPSGWFVVGPDGKEHAQRIAR